MRLNQRGSIQSSALTVGFAVLFVASTAFGIWAFMGRADYKNNSDKKSATAVATAKEEQKATDEADFLEREKQPYETFDGPSEFGSIKIVYPKTWELYVDVKTTGSGTSVDGYAHPIYVPGVQSDTAFALRFQVIGDDYTSLLKQYESSTKNGSVTVAPFRAVLVDSVLGARIDGEITTKRTGSVVLLPLRDKTLKIWTESNAYTADFDEILANLSFSP
ncbi:MAG: hypothetical protein AAB624_02740 [Patescibacteria group bacterium]